MYNDTERNSSQLADESYSTGEGMIWKSVLKDKMEDDEFKIGLKILQREKN